MHGANVMLICMLLRISSKPAMCPFVSGVLNACTYVGSALSIYGVAVITEKFGWGTTVKIWAAVAALRGNIFACGNKAMEEVSQNG